MKDDPNEIEVAREDNQSDARVFQVFRIYGRWSVEEMKNLPMVRGMGRDLHVMFDAE